MTNPSKKLCFIDFEYNNSQEKILNLVSSAYSTNTGKERKDWLYLNPDNKESLKSNLETLHKENYIFVAYAVTAEARSFLSLGIDPIPYKWIDLYLEYRCLTNHNAELMWGKQLRNGKIITTYPPSSDLFGIIEEENNSKPEHNLAAACFKLLNKKIDTKEKDEVRDIIISDTDINKNSKRILDYNFSDIALLPELFKAILKEYKRLLVSHPNNLKTLFDEMLLRGDYAARTAVMESLGYPVKTEELTAFSDSVASILYDCKEEINSLFPSIKPFKKKRSRDHRWDQIATKKWIVDQGYDKWPKTDKNSISLKLEAWTKYFPYQHNYPKDCFGAQMVRFLKLKQSLNGFSPTAKKTIFQSLGSDGRVRPFFGIYGAQSARSQPAATGFLFLKAAWIRSLCMPPKGKYICGIDYGSQEFLISALHFKDKAMKEAYYSGDPYLWMAKQAGAVPPEGTKKTHPKERDLFKSTTLGILYMMTKYGLSKKLTRDTGRKYDKEEAQDLIDMFEELFPDFTQGRNDLVDNYEFDDFIKLPCGWYMWGDNPNPRSVGNVPIQGAGSSIMRRAVSLSQDQELHVIKTLHDAVYIEFEEAYEVIRFRDCMDRAFQYFFPNEKIKLDMNIWGEGAEKKWTKYFSKAKIQDIYIDERAVEEYEKFSKYFKGLNFEEII